MNGEADDDFDDDESEIQHDTDDKGPVNAGQVDGMVMVTKAVGMVMATVIVAVAAMIVVVVVMAVVDVILVAMVIVGVVAMIVCLFHNNFLPVIVPGRRKSVDNPAICDSDSRVGYIRRNNVVVSGVEEVFFASYDHFQLSFHDISDLFVYMIMHRCNAALSDFPEYKGAFIAVDHLSQEARAHFLNRCVAEVLHE